MIIFFLIKPKGWLCNLALQKIKLKEEEAIVNFQR